MRQPLQSLLPRQVSLTPRRSSPPLPNNSRGSLDEAERRAGLPKALVMHMEFGAVSSEQRGNAWVRVKRESRSLQRSERVPRGVRGSKWAWVQNTRGYTRSLPQPLLRRVLSLTRPRAPQSDKQHDGSPLQIGTGSDCRLQAKSATLLKKQTLGVTQERISGKEWRSCLSKDRACLMTVEAAAAAAAGCSLHGWLKADTSIKAHEYSVTK